MAKPQIKNDAYDTLKAVVAVTAAWSTYQHPEWWPVTGTLSAMAAYKLLSAPVQSTSQSTFAALREWERMTIKPRQEGGYNAKWKTRPMAEYIFQSNELECPVPEGVLHKFISIGRRREMNARTGSRVNMMAAGQTYRRLKITEAWSKNYILGRSGFIEPAYNSCVIVATLTGYFYPPRQGHPGHLINWLQSTNQVVDGIKDQWLFLHQSAPGRLRAPLLSIA